MMVFGETDGVSHYFWQYCDPGCPFFTSQPAGLRDSMLRVYQEIDRQTGELLELVPEHTNILVLSDHGSGGVSNSVLFPNRWLAAKGLLHFRSQSTQWVSRLRELLKHWGIATLPAWVQRRLYRSAWRALGRFEARARYSVIDWSRTVAYFDENPYFPVLRVNAAGARPHGIVPPGRPYEELRDRLIQELESWRHPETGERLVEKAYRREDVYSGECLNEAADIVPKWALDRGYNLGFRLSSKSPDGSWFARVNPFDPDGPLYPRKFSSHRDHGIFVAHGPDFPRGETVNGARIIDLAPTILTLLDVAVPDDMDGRVLHDVLVATEPQSVSGHGAFQNGSTALSRNGARITRHVRVADLRETRRLRLLRDGS
jgi:predicted AlkP superfamily phosphohydrolase/phosphomutase